MRVFGKSMCDGRNQRNAHQETFELNEEVIADTDSSRVPLLSTEERNEVDREEELEERVVEDSPKESHTAVVVTDSGDEANDLYDTIQGIYNIGVEESRDKAGLYGKMMHYYAEKATFIPHPPRRRTASVMWYMLAILISNPFIGFYTMRHFKDWGEWVTRDVVVVGSAPEASAQAPIASEVTMVSSWLNMGDYTGILNTGEAIEHGERMAATQEELDTMTKVASLFSKKVRGYACYEIFGELVFGLFSLSLLCASNICCTNGRHRAQSMIPLIGVLYTVIYKILAMYILIISLEILFFYWVAAYPEMMGKLPGVLLRFCTIGGIDPAEEIQRASMSRLLQLDRSAHRWVILYCLENIYITISDSVETVYALSKILKRSIRKLIRKIKRQQDLVYFTMGSAAELNEAVESEAPTYCSYMFLDSLLNKTAGLHETYIHHMYNRGLSDVGTYLNNVGVEQYQDSIELMGKKILKHVRGSNDHENAD